MAIVLLTPITKADTYTILFLLVVEQNNNLRQIIYPNKNFKILSWFNKSENDSSWNSILSMQITKIATGYNLHLSGLLITSAPVCGKFHIDFYYQPITIM